MRSGCGSRRGGSSCELIGGRWLHVRTNRQLPEVGGRYSSHRRARSLAPGPKTRTVGEKRTQHICHVCNKVMSTSLKINPMHSRTKLTVRRDIQLWNHAACTKNILQKSNLSTDSLRIHTVFSPFRSIWPTISCGCFFPKSRQRSLPPAYNRPDAALQESTVGNGRPSHCNKESRYQTDEPSHNHVWYSTTNRKCLQAHIAHLKVSTDLNFRLARFKRSVPSANVEEQPVRVIRSENSWCSSHQSPTQATWNKTTKTARLGSDTALTPIRNKHCHVRSQGDTQAHQVIRRFQVSSQKRTRHPVHRAWITRLSQQMPCTFSTPTD